MKREPRAFLWDIVQACDALDQFLAGVAFAEYTGSLQLKSAVERQLITVGEAMAQLSRVDPDLAARIPEHREVIAFRNVLVHGYASLRDDEVWRAIIQSLPRLRSAAQALMGDPDSQSGP